MYANTPTSALLKSRMPARPSPCTGTSAAGKPGAMVIPSGTGATCGASCCGTNASGSSQKVPERSAVAPVVAEGEEASGTAEEVDEEPTTDEEETPAESDAPGTADAGPEETPDPTAPEDAVPDRSGTADDTKTEDETGEAPEPELAPPAPPAVSCPAGDVAADRRVRPPTFRETNPISRLVAGQSPGKTFWRLNGVASPAGVSIGALSAAYIAATPLPAVVSRPGPGGSISCCFDAGYQMVGSTVVDIPSAPSSTGWHLAGVDPRTVLVPADHARCAGKSSVPVTFRADPNDAAHVTRVRAAEMEHVTALSQLHQKHLVPFYRQVTGISALGQTGADCENTLRTQIAAQHAKATLGFILGDIGETARLDDPNRGTHTGVVTPTIDPGCTGITLTAKPPRARRAGTGPGNTRTIRPTVTAINPNRLRVRRTRLVQGLRTIETFSSAGNAARALAVFQHHNIDEIHRLGDFVFLLSNGNAPSGPLSGAVDRHIDPDLYQVTNLAGGAGWAIVETQAGQTIQIHPFGADRDRAFSAVDLMRQHRFNRESFIGPAANADLRYFRSD